MKRTLNILTGTLFTLLVISITSCRILDVVGNDSVRSFGELLQNSPQSVSQDMKNSGWSFSAPDGSARFVWSSNFAESPVYDVLLEFDAAPFITAGLDPSRLPDAISFHDGKLIVGTKLGNETLSYKGEPTPLASYQQIVKLKRSTIGYHGAMDHYGINLGGGNLFEWAKNLNANDKDIVFVLEPTPFINAGVAPDRIEGWVFAKVPVDDENGKMIEVDKIIKPFDLQ